MKQTRIQLIDGFPFLFPFAGSEDVLKFQGNDTVVDYFKLVLRDGNSLLVGSR